MKVNPSDYGKGRGAPMMFNIRLRRFGARPTWEEVVGALRDILNTGTVPPGWQFAAINWRHPKAARDGWSLPGDLVDLDTLGAPIRDQLDSLTKRNVDVRSAQGRSLASLQNARVGVVRDVDDDDDDDDDGGG